MKCAKKINHRAQKVVVNIQSSIRFDFFFSLEILLEYIVMHTQPANSNVISNVTWNDNRNATTSTSFDQLIPIRQKRRVMHTFCDHNLFACLHIYITVNNCVDSLKSLGNVYGCQFSVAHYQSSKQKNQTKWFCQAMLNIVWCFKPKKQTHQILNARIHNNIGTYTYQRN